MREWARQVRGGETTCGQALGWERAVEISRVGRASKGRGEEKPERQWG